MGTPARILVVEDDPNMRSLLNAYLTRRGYVVREARDGDAALRVLHSEQEVDLLLTDIVMPGKCDGFALSREARRLRPGLKVLHVTGYSNHFHADPHMVNSGAIMQKPLDRGQLLDRVEQLLSRWAVDQNEVLQRAYQYWLDKGKGQVPDRKAFDPIEVKDMLPYLSIFELVGEPPRYRCRLAGTRVVEALGFNPANRFVDEVFGKSDAEFLERLIDDVSARGQPLYAASGFQSSESGISTERLLLPFALGGSDPRQIIMVQTFDWTQRTGAFHEMAQQLTKRTDSVQWKDAAGAEPV